jgi:acyl-CoA thioesterase
MSESPVAPFTGATTLQHDEAEPGRYRGVVDDHWQLAVVPQGGIVAAVAARAMANELATPEQALRSFTAVFAAQVAVGPVDVDVQVLRRGRSLSQVAATVRNPGAKAGLTALAVFGAVRPGFFFTDRPYPEGLDAPESYPSMRDPWPDDVEPRRFDPMPFWEDVVETRFITGHPPWEDYTPTSSEQLYWTRFDAPPFAHDGNLDPLGLLVLADAMPGAVGERMGNDSPPWFGPSADLTFHWFGHTRSEWLLVRNQARHAGDGYASVDAELWDPITESLVGYATQQMIFAFADEIPTGEQIYPVDQRHS